MPDQFDQFIAQTRGFLAELAANNSRDWFTANKPHYEAQLKDPALVLLDQVTPQLSRMLEQAVKPKLYRAHRDVRFSKDKSPYKLHLHMLWSPQGTGTQPAYFFGIAEGYVTAGAGLMGFDKAQQSAWRAFVCEREGTALQARLDALTAAGCEVREPELKRIPSPFGKDHPNAELLRRKSLVVHKDIAERAQTCALPDAIMEAFASFDPVMDDLRAFL